MNALAYSAATNSALIAAGSALAGAIIGGLITLVVTSLQTRHATAERQAAAADARRERAAAILGRVRPFLTDIDPARIGMNVNPEATPKELEALAARRNILRDELSILSAASEDDRLMTRTADLELAVFNTHAYVSWHARDVLGSRDIRTSLEMARNWHDRALTLVEIVLGLIHGREIAELEAQLHSLEEQWERLSNPGVA